MRDWNVLKKKDYPVEAIRKALLNAIVHRDYIYSGSIIINITEKEMEFISIGGLLPDLTSEDIRSGISQPRNKKIGRNFSSVAFNRSLWNRDSQDIRFI